MSASLESSGERLTEGTAESFRQLSAFRRRSKTLGEAEITVLHTPGHTAGSICLYAPPFLIAGDTLFPGGPGLTKRPGADFALIVESIRDKLFTLPEATIVYPGHGRGTTIGAEKPHLAEWIERGW